MFGTNTVSSGLSLGKVLSGISKTLSVANQLIPLYQQAKPMINNTKTIISALKNLKVNQPKSIQLPKTTANNNDSQENTSQTLVSNNIPVFFQ